MGETAEMYLDTSKAGWTHVVRNWGKVGGSKEKLRTGSQRLLDRGSQLECKTWKGETWG